jgi:hypothetical protein
MRPDVGPDSSWVDAPTTTEEETSKASIPRFVGVGNGFVPVAKSTDEGQIVEGSVVRCDSPDDRQEVVVDDDDDDKTVEMDPEDIEEVVVDDDDDDKTVEMDAEDIAEWEMMWK